jgi:hypothetical protein
MMNRGHSGIFVFLVSALLSSGALAQQPLGVPFTLGVGQSTLVGAGGLVVGFTEITADSRCPLSVICIWEGDAEAALWAEVPTLPRTDFALHTYRDWPRVALYDGYSITLQLVEPYPIVPGPIDPDQYVVTLQVDESGVARQPATWGLVKALYGD